MYYGFEEPIEAPKVAIWDMLPMMLYISLLKDRYDKTQEKLDKFAEKWGDLVSPIAKDNAYILNNTIGMILRKLDDMVANGIDPYRSVEGLNMIANMIRSANTQQLKDIKSSIPLYQEFMKNKAKMDAEGRYDPRLVQLLLEKALPGEFKGKGITPEQWDSATMGVFPITAPVEAKSITELTEDVYKALAPVQILRRGDATPEDINRLGKDKAKYYNIKGVLENDKQKARVASKHLLDLTLYGQYFRNIAADSVKAYLNSNPDVLNNVAANERNDYVSELIEREYENMIEEANRHHWQEKDEINDLAKDDYTTNNDIRAHGAKAAIDYNYAKKEMADQFEYAKKRFAFEHPELYKDDGTPRDIPETTLKGFSTAEHLYTNSIARALNMDINTFDIQNVNNGQYGGSILSPYNIFLSKQELIVKNNTQTKDKEGKVSRFTNQGINNIVSSLSRSFNTKEVGSILAGKHADNLGNFKLTRALADRLYSRQHIISRMRGNNFSSYESTTKELRQKIDFTKENRVAPTGRVMAYLSKDGTIRLMAECRVIHDTTTPDHSSTDMMFMDLGMRSNKLSPTDVNFSFDLNKSLKALDTSRIVDGMKNTEVLNFLVTK